MNLYPLVGFEPACHSTHKRRTDNRGQKVKAGPNTAGGASEVFGVINEKREGDRKCAGHEDGSGRGTRMC